MKTIIILVAISILLIGCAKSAPEFPGIKNMYGIHVRGEELPQAIADKIENYNEINMALLPEISCLKFEVVSKNPHIIKFVGAAKIKQCNGVLGLQADDDVLLYNWVDDVIDWLKEKKCLK